LSGLAADGGRRELQVEKHWFHKGGVVLKFAGVESISDAEGLSGLELQVSLQDRTKLEAGSAYVSEIVGCEVWSSSGDQRRFLGMVAEVRHGTGEAPLLIVRKPALSATDAGKGGTPGVSGEGDEQEFLVPYADEFVEVADFAQRRIEMQLPEGMLELEAPLSVEEKQRQKVEADETRGAGARRRKRK